MKPHDHIILEIARERERALAMVERGCTAGYMAQQCGLPNTAEHYEGGGLVDAAVCYARGAARQERGASYEGTPDFWPWEAGNWWPGDARANLVRAAVMIVAEIERLDRAKAKD